MGWCFYVYDKMGGRPLKIAEYELPSLDEANYHRNNHINQGYTVGKIFKRSNRW